MSLAEVIRHCEIAAQQYLAQRLELRLPDRRGSSHRRLRCVSCVFSRLQNLRYSIRQMDAIFSVLKYLVFGFFGLIGLLFVLALLFGKRIIKRWEYEAKFHDDNGREFAEFDIELSRIAKKETVDTFKAEFKLRHESLKTGQRVQVFLDDVLVLEGMSERAGRIRLGAEHIKIPLEAASAGQLCRVVYGGVEQFSAEIIPD